MPLFCAHALHPNFFFEDEPPLYNDHFLHDWDDRDAPS
jgi:hypothetical protein